MATRLKTSKIYEYWNEIPTYNGITKEWTTTDFKSKDEFRDFVQSIFIEDGPETGYKFDKTVSIFNEQARKYLETGTFCDAPDLSMDFIKYWETQSERNRRGVIVYGENGKIWYLTRDYYMWINFLPIFHKEKRVFQFPDIYDGQYHVALAETLAELRGEHIVMLKRRQYAMSYYHIAKLINQIWFEEGVTLKLLASSDSFINAEGSWAFLNEYRDFLNDKTAWYRNFEPDKVGNWLQRIKTTVNGRDVYRGRKGRIINVTTQQSPVRGVGGAARYVMYEEAGVASTLDKTYGYVKAALEAGPFLVIGQFIAFGSVGDLKQCEPLKKFMHYPKKNGFFSVTTKLFDDKQIPTISGLFIPATWNMLGFIDEFGNSDTKGALKALLEKRVQQKRDLEPEAYQLEISQHPTTISEAFDWREESVFPTALIKQQIQKVEDGTYGMEYIELAEDENKNVISKKSNRIPILEYPVDKKRIDKTGVIIVYERPDQKKAWGTYSASIDPVAVGSTTSSDSLCSIIVYKNPIEVITHLENGETKSSIEGDKIVCTWTGRFDDINKTHERLEFIIRWYNAWTLCEVNVALFIQYMILKKLQHYLVPKDQVLFLKELSSKGKYQDYGWRNVGVLFRNNILPYGIQFVQEEMDRETDVHGTTLSIKYGVERIPDLMLLKEMREYRHGANADRIIAFCSLIAFVHVQHANKGYLKKIEYTKELENSQNYSKLKLNPFRLMGNVHSPQDQRYQTKRNPFKNLR